MLFSDKNWDFLQHSAMPVLLAECCLLVSCVYLMNSFVSFVVFS